MEKTRIGKILNAHGVRGELKVEPLTDNPERYNLLEQVYVEDRSILFMILNRYVFIKGMFW